MRRKNQIAGSYIARLLGTVFMAVVALGALPDQTIGQSEKKVPVAQAEKRIGAHIKYIEKRVGEMVATFYYTGAKKTLENSFKKNGVTRSMGNADSWGTMGIGLTWSQSAQEFYSYHLKVLTDSLRVIREQGFAKESDLAYLDRGMKAWEEYEQEFPKQFQRMVDLYTEEALVYDEKSAKYEKYSNNLRQLQGRKLYPASEIDALNSELSRANKTFDDRVKEIEKPIQRVKDRIAKMAAERLFSVINESGRIETGSAIGANERERP